MNEWIAQIRNLQKKIIYKWLKCESNPECNISSTVIQKHNKNAHLCVFRREQEVLQRSIEANRRNLKTMESSRSNRLRRFGEHMPALLNAIQEAHKKGQFKHKPRGPLGKTQCEAANPLNHWYNAKQKEQHI